MMDGSDHRTADLQRMEVPDMRHPRAAKRRTLSLIFALSLIGMLALSACRGPATTTTPSTPAPVVTDTEGDASTDATTDGKPVAVITMADGGVIRVALEHEAAPETVANFIKLAGEAFYDGTIFHRVIPGFMIQGGDPDGTGMGGPAHTIKGEFERNGVKNPLKHTRGVISMARSQDFNSAGSQFFIVHQTSSHLDGQYAAFGTVIEGMDVVDRIAATPTDANDRPNSEQKMASIRIEG